MGNLPPALKGAKHEGGYFVSCAASGDPQLLHTCRRPIAEKVMHEQARCAAAALSASKCFQGTLCRLLYAPPDSTSTQS
jgi:hypothetical protein